MATVYNKSLYSTRGVLLGCGIQVLGGIEKTISVERTPMLTHVWVFFYGAFMSPVVLGEHGVTPGRIVPAKLNGYELSLRPRGNVMRSERSCVYGVMTEVTHEDLAKLYSDLDELFGLKYFPEAMLAEAFDGTVRPVLCYIAPHMEDAPATKEYVDALAEAVRAAGLPEWYAEFVESFGPKE